MLDNSLYYDNFEWCNYTAEALSVSCVAVGVVLPSAAAVAAVSLVSSCIYSLLPTSSQLRRAGVCIY